MSLDLSAIIPLAAAAAVFALVLAASLGLAGRRELLARIRAVATPREQRSAPRPGGRTGGEAARGPLEALHGLVARIARLRDRRSSATAAMLARAGWRSKEAHALYLFAKACLPPALGTLGAVVLFVVDDFGLGPVVRAMLVGTLAIAGSSLPDTVVRKAADRRRAAIRKALPDTLDLMVICAEAGLSLDATLARVAREIAPTSPALADELGLTVLELRFLPERRKPLDNLVRRVDLAAVQAIVNTLVQTEKFGTPLAQALRVLARELRSERMLRAEEKAARLPAVMTVPLIVFILPALFVVLMGAAILDIIDVMSAF